MKKLLIAIFMMATSLAFPQPQDNVITCSCMQFETDGSNSCTTGVSYTIQPGTGGCCSGVAVQSHVATMTMDVMGNITSFSYGSASGSVGQLLCC